MKHNKNDEQVSSIRGRLAAGETQTSIAARSVGISQQTISLIKNNKT